MKVSCKKCEATQKKRKEKFKAPPKPPRLRFSSGTQTEINGPAVQKFGLSKGYFRIIKRDDGYYLQSSEEKKEGFFTFTPKHKGTALHCAARGIMRNAGLTGSERFRIVEQAGKRLYRLEEENPAA